LFLQPNQSMDNRPKTPATVPITMPAISPPLRPLEPELAETTGVGVAVIKSEVVNVGKT
jgi:hypothetical protein